MADHLTITHYTDPICPFAFSAEPLLRRLEWRLDTRATWRIRLVGLAESVDELTRRGLTPQVLDANFARLGDTYGMPVDRTPRERLVASLPACRAVTAAGFSSPERATAMLRALRVRHFAGELIDESPAIRGAAVDAGLDPDEVERMAGTPVATDTLADDMEAARRPSPEALAQLERLAEWAGGLRYTCPSLEFERASDGRRIAAPGFQPREAYDMAVANLVPRIEPRPAPGSVREVLDWAPFPLATAEIAAVCDTSAADIREELRATAHFTAVGPDGYWSLTS